MHYPPIAVRFGIFTIFPAHLQSNLISAAQAVIDDVCKKQLGRMKRPPRIEIDYVASLIENGADEIAKRWQSILAPSMKVSVAGVFCHQSPMVRISGTPPYPVSTVRCELADLLILASHINAAGKEYWRAVLMQTKMVGAAGSIKPDEPQFWLYNQWPLFSILSPSFRGGLRDFNADHRSGQYGLLSNKSWLVSDAHKPIATTSTLAEFLVAMLYDLNPDQPNRTSLHGRQVYRFSKYDWSPTIHELLQLTAVKALRHKGKKQGLYAGDMSRMGGQVLQLFMEQSRSVPPDFPIKPDDGGGVSVLVIQTIQRG